MSIIVEDGSVVANADSLISVADADAYFVNKGAPAAWTGSDEDKEVALRIGSKMVNNRHKFVGSIVDTTDQVFVWPRLDAYDSEDRYYADTIIPQPVKDAVCEYALIHLRDGDLSLPVTQGTKKIKLDVLEIENFSDSEGGSSEPDYSYIDDLLKLLTAGGGSNWATVRRHY